MTIYRRYGLRLLITLLVLVYTFTNAGRFHIIDEVSLFALTESVAQRGAVDTNAIAWTQWVNSPGEVLGEFGPDGQVFSKKGPAPALLAVPWYWLLRWIAQLEIEIGLLQGTLLWNGIVTALTAALLWLTARQLGYNDRTGAVLGLFFGLGTIAWPYANHFFGEPLSAFALLLTFYSLLCYRNLQQTRWLWLAGLGAGIAIITVTAHALLVAILLAYWLFGELQLWLASRQEQSAPAFSLRPVLAASSLITPLLLASAFLLWYNRIRFGDPFATGYHFDSGEGFTTPIWQGLWGLLISPYRGVFWHTPIFLATLFGFLPFLRRHRDEGWLIAALSLTLIGLYSTWWMWWGGFAWGPRFLVPLSPFWILILAPLVEETITRSQPADRRRRSWAERLQSLDRRGVLLLALFFCSFVVQILAVSVNYVNYESRLRERFPSDFSDPLAFPPPAQSLADWLSSPVFGQIELLTESLRAHSDLAWLPIEGGIHWQTLLISLAGIGTILFAGWQWWQSQPTNRRANGPSWPTRTLLPLLAVLGMATWLGESSSDPLYGQPDEGYRAILSEVCDSIRPTDAMISIAPYAYHLPMNWLAGDCDSPLPIFGYAANSMEHPEAQQVLGRVAQVYERIWFVTGGMAPNDPDNTVEQWLAAAAYKADDRWYGDYRLVRYASPQALSNAQEVPLDMFLTDLQGQQVTIWAARAPGVVSAQQIIPVELIYQLDTPVTANLRWFVQLLTADDTPIALIDTTPAQGYASFPNLAIGQQFVEKVALQLPERMTPGRYRLIAGLYNPDQPAPNRLITPTGRDSVDLGILVVR